MKKKQNLSEYKKQQVTNIDKFNFGIVVAEWNEKITESLYNAAYETFRENGVLEQNIHRINVPGTFELTYGAKLFSQDEKIDAVIVLGCVIQGETRHFDFICQGVTHGITTLNLQYDKPVIFGVLTTNTMEQALARAGGKHGNKGVEAASTAIKMVQI